MASMISTIATGISHRSRPFLASDAGFRVSSVSVELLRLRGGCDVRGLGRIGCSGDWRTPRRLRASADSSPESLDFTDGEQSDSTKSANSSFWKNWQMNAGELKEKVAKLGRAGLLAYGLFNAVTYTTFFFIAFLAFEKTGQNPTKNLKACLGGMVSMWTGNNFTRPLRVAGAAALAPFMDKVLKTTQKVMHLADEASAFLFLVSALCALCAAAVGILILSRLGR